MESLWVRILAPPLVTGYEDKGHKTCENRRGSCGVTRLGLATQGPYILRSLSPPLFSPPPGGGTRFLGQGGGAPGQHTHVSALRGHTH